MEIKKLVSSEKSENILESEVNSTSYELGNKSFTNKPSPKNVSTSGDNAVKNQNGIIASPNYVHSSEGFVEDVKTPPQMASSRIYSNEKLKDKALETNRPGSLSAFFANGTEHLSLEVENQVGSESTPIEGEGETEIPQPLAGTNVMNVILVAAECAPWSKTGNNFICVEGFPC